MGENSRGTRLRLRSVLAAVLVTAEPAARPRQGNFRVEWKNANHRSTEFDGAPMPFAVFFAEGGIAFHEGRLDSHSAGCVRLGHEDAASFYDFLEVDEPVRSGDR